MGCQSGVERALEDVRRSTKIEVASLAENAREWGEWGEVAVLMATREIEIAGSNAEVDAWAEWAGSVEQITEPAEILPRIARDWANQIDRVDWAGAAVWAGDWVEMEELAETSSEAAALMARVAAETSAEMAAERAAEWAQATAENVRSLAADAAELAELLRLLE